MSQPPSRSSNAIHSGADLILALLEERIKKHEEANLSQLRDLEARFEQFKGKAEMSHAKIASKVREVEAELERTKKDLSTAYLDKVEAYTLLAKAESEAVQAKGQLDVLKRSLHAFGLIYSDDLVLKYDGETAEASLKTLKANEVTSPTSTIEIATMVSVTSSVSQHVELQQRLVNKWEEKYSTLKEKRDFALNAPESLPEPGKATVKEEFVLSSDLPQS